MADSDPIICRPTPWFLWRATAILLMFLVFSVLFYIDGSTGYRHKNEVFYLHKTFKSAAEQFAELNKNQSLSPEEWRQFAAKQTVALPSDPYLLPAGTPKSMPWPELLLDYERMKPLQWQKLWLDYSATRGFPSEAPEHPFDRRKIQEQWIVMWICATLATTTLFFLARTSRRRITADAESLTSPQGKRIPFADIHRLDLRKWDTKGIAHLDYNGPTGKGRLRLDGLTYGGFRKADGQPAERLMQRIRAHFSGELLEYTVVPADEETTGDDPLPKP